MNSVPITEKWCRDNLQGYEIKEDATAVDFVVAKCENGSDAMVTFNKTRPSQKDFPRVFVSNFYVEHIKTVDDLGRLVRSLGFGNDRPWKLPSEQDSSDCACGNPGGDNEECERCRMIAELTKAKDLCRKFESDWIAAKYEFVKSFSSARNQITKLEAELSELKESLADHYQCDVCKKWRHVEDMLKPHGNTDDLCCDEGCCEAWNDRVV